MEDAEACDLQKENEEIETEEAMIEEDEIGEEEKMHDIAEPTTPSPVRVSEGVKQEKSSKKRIGGGSKPGTYAAQCAECMKWRKVPNKEVFEEIRELAERDPFVCEKVREWTEGSQVSCQDEPDLSPEGNERMWLMDKPCIPRPPNGWERLVYLRKNPTGNKFADVYYVSPCGKRLRSGTELAKFFDSNVHYKEQGVSLSQFNFQTPRPLLQVLSENSSKKKKKQRIGNV